MSDKPEYTPAYRLPVWLSSEEVKEAIVKVAQAGGCKATCWDLNWEINNLIERAREQ